MLLRQIIDNGLAQYAYLVGCRQSGEAIVIDPQRDVDRYIELAGQEGLKIVAVAETHIHADFLSGTRELAELHDARLYVSDEGSDEWKYEWVKSSDVDYVLLRDGDTFRVGEVAFQAVHTPGHTPEHLSFLVTDRGGGIEEPMGIMTGDFVFVGDFGRPDLLESAARAEGMMIPSARRLYRSAEQFLGLADYLQVWPGHGAGSACGKSLGAVPETTVGYERRFSPAVEAMSRGEDGFVAYVLEEQQDPPLYFARMKHMNRDGVPILGALPLPSALSVNGLIEHVSAEEYLLLDTREDQKTFASHHIRGALHAPLGISFSSFVGSLVVDESVPIILLVTAEQLEEAVRRLVRIGYDHIVGWADFETMESYLNGGGEAASIELINFDELERLRSEPGVVVSDARYGYEYRRGHVPGAVHASYTRLPEREDDLPRNGTLLVHCESGIRSTAAAAYLARTGRDVQIVFDEWKNYEAKYEVVQEE